MPRCPGEKPDGSRCTILVATEGSLCYFHDPGKAAARRRNASKGGRSRWGGEFATVRGEVQDAIRELRTGELEPKTATALWQGYNVLLRLIEAERGSRLEDLEGELRDLESLIAGRGSSSGIESE